MYFSTSLTRVCDVEKYISKQSSFSFGFLQGKTMLSFSLKKEVCLDTILTKNKAYKRLDAYLLHHWVFEKLLGKRIKEDDISYAKSVSQVKKDSQKVNGCSFILRSVRIEDVMDIAFKNLTLPQKTTYFYPKFLSGLALRTFSRSVGHTV